METILREFIEDDTYNSQNSCNIIKSFDEKLMNKPEEKKEKNAQKSDKKEESKPKDIKEEPRLETKIEDQDDFEA